MPSPLVATQKTSLVCANHSQSGAIRHHAQRADAVPKGASASVPKPAVEQVKWRTLCSRLAQQPGHRLIPVERSAVKVEIAPIIDFSTTVPLTWLLMPGPVAGAPGISIPNPLPRQVT